MASVRHLSQRKRNRANRVRNPFIVIGCEGKNKTEKIYFQNYASRKCIIKFSDGNSTDPEGIVKDLIKYVSTKIEREENDKIYAVFDTDVNQNKQIQIAKAKELALKNEIEVVTSTPSFEIWFLLHFIYTTKIFYSNIELRNTLKKYISDYSKNVNVYPMLYDKTNKAIANAKKLEKYQLDKVQALQDEKCNPYTAIYKVIEQIQNR